MNNGRWTVMIGGRESLPIRAIPYVTAWNESPDSIVSALARPPIISYSKGLNIRDRHALCAYQMFDQSHYEPIPASQWKDLVITLNSLTKRLRANEREGATDENHGPWRIDAILSLPDNVFVWLDEFESWFSMTRPMISSECDKNRLREWQAALERPSPDLEEIDELDAELFQPAGESLCMTAMLPPEIEGRIWRYAATRAMSVVGERADHGDIGVGGKAAVTIHRLPSRRSHLLDPVIKQAKSESLPPHDTSAVWAALVQMASSIKRPAPLLGYVDNEGSVQYQSSNGAKFFTRRNLSDRMSREKNALSRAKPR